MADPLNADWRAYSENLKAHARKHAIPISGTFELTPLCNFRCPMCYVRLSPERMREVGRLRSAEDWVDMARQAKEAGMVFLTLTGGEVLTRADFPEIYQGVAEQGLVLSVLSNGYLVNDEIVSLFERYRPSQYRVTLYGASNETYSKFAPANDAFDRVLGNLKTLQEVGVPVSLAYTITKDNVDDARRIKEIAYELGARTVFSGGLVGGVRGAVNRAKDLRVPKEKLPVLDDDQKAREPSEEAISRASQIRMDPFARCNAYRCSFWLDWNGCMDTCAFMSFANVYPFESGFRSAWDEMCLRLSKLHLPKECTTCKYINACDSCPGRRAADGGDPECVVAAHCQEAQNRLVMKA